MKPMDLQVGDVVQISPDLESCFFRGCFLMVTEPKSWGCQGFVSIPESRDKMPGQAFFRCKWEDMEYVGQAAWAPDRDQGG